MLGYVEVHDCGLGGYSVLELKEMISYAPEHPATYEWKSNVLFPSKIYFAREHKAHIY